MTPVSIAAVGDIMLGDSPQVFGYGVASAIRRDGGRRLFDAVGTTLQEADLTVANLEIALSKTPARARFSDRIYRGDPAVAPVLRAAGIDVVSVCTNHTMQHGEAAFAEFIACLREAGLAVSGADLPTPGVSRQVLCERQGVRIAVLSYNFRPMQYTAAAPAWPAPDLPLILGDIEQARGQADVVMVTLHWGDEFISYPSPWQVTTARALVDAGAAIVIGHHPHIVQGVESHRGGVIAYSLGNFVFDQWQPRLRRSMILHLTVHDPRRVEYRIEPVFIDDGYRPVPCADRQRVEELAYHQSLSQLIGRHDESTYQSELAARYQEFRREIAVHYLTKVWTFKPTDLLANVAEMVRRRL
jgi:poly-gamma-glutamate synthesis protein (capsule biosynthesis protein)